MWHCDCHARWHSIVSIWKRFLFCFPGTEKLHFYNCTNFCLQLHTFFTTAQSVHNCTLKKPCSARTHIVRSALRQSRERTRRNTDACRWRRCRRLDTDYSNTRHGLQHNQLRNCSRVYYYFYLIIIIIIIILLLSVIINLVVIFTALCIARYCYSKSSVRPSVRPSARPSYRDVDVPWPCKLS